MPWLVTCGKKAFGADFSLLKTVGLRPSYLLVLISLSCLEAYPDILLLDCAYNANKYKMALLDIIGVDAS